MHFFTFMLLSFDVVNVSIPAQLFLILIFLRLLFVERGVFNIINFDNIYICKPIYIIRC